MSAALPGDPTEPGMVTHSGGCHCGAVRVEVDAPAVLDVNDCNCSICTPYGGYAHLVVPRSRFRLLRGADRITTYSFNTGIAQHHFCSVCGVKSFYVPRSHPHAYSVNARCLDPATIEALNLGTFDGQNWEKHVHELPDAGD